MTLLRVFESPRAGDAVRFGGELSGVTLVVVSNNAGFIVADHFTRDRRAPYALTPTRISHTLSQWRDALFSGDSAHSHAVLVEEGTAEVGGASKEVAGASASEPKSIGAPTGPEWTALVRLLDDAGGHLLTLRQRYHKLHPPGCSVISTPETGEGCYTCGDGLQQFLDTLCKRIESERHAMKAAGADKPPPGTPTLDFKTIEKRLKDDIVGSLGSLEGAPEPDLQSQFAGALGAVTKPSAKPIECEFCAHTPHPGRRCGQPDKRYGVCACETSDDIIDAVGSLAPKPPKATDPPMRDEYDFAGGVRGKYAARVADRADSAGGPTPDGAVLGWLNAAIGAYAGAFNAVERQGHAVITGFGPPYITLKTNMGTFRVSLSGEGRVIKPGETCGKFFAGDDPCRLPPGHNGGCEHVTPKPKRDTNNSLIEEAERRSRGEPPRVVPARPRVRDPWAGADPKKVVEALDALPPIDMDMRAHTLMNKIDEEVAGESDEELAIKLIKSVQKALRSHGEEERAEKLDKVIELLTPDPDAHVFPGTASHCARCGIARHMAVGSFGQECKPRVPTAEHRVVTREAIEPHLGKTVPVRDGFEGPTVGSATLRREDDALVAEGTLSPEMAAKVEKALQPPRTRITIPEELIKAEEECGPSGVMACSPEVLKRARAAAREAGAWCHALPQSEWCDKDGPGGFMGHMCSPGATSITGAKIPVTPSPVTREEAERLARERPAAPSFGHGRSDSPATPCNVCRVLATALAGFEKGIGDRVRGWRRIEALAANVKAAQATNAKASPRPWSVGLGWEQMDPGVYIADAKGGIVYAPGDESDPTNPATADDVQLSEANARLLVDAVNAHDERIRFFKEMTEANEPNELRVEVEARKPTAGDTMTPGGTLPLGGARIGGAAPLTGPPSIAFFKPKPGGTTPL